MSFRLTKLGYVSLITFLFSIPILVAGILLSKISDCGLVGVEMGTEMICTAIFIMIISAFGILVSGFRWRCLIVLYHSILIITIVVGLILASITMSKSNKGSGESIPGKGYKEYRLGVYPKWIRKVVNDTKTWNKAKTCLVDTKICTNFNTKYQNDTAEKFYKHSFSAIKSGCCKPSNDCGFTYISPTNWTEENGVFNNPDCNAWDNDPKVLCYNCQSCKAAMVDKLKNGISKYSKIDITFFVFLLIVWCFGVYADRIDIKHYSSTY